MLLIVGLMIWQHVAEERLAVPAGVLWTPDRSPFPGLEAFTEEDSAVFFGREAEITELLGRLHPVVEARTNRLISVVGPPGVGKSSLVQAGVVPRLRQRRRSLIVVPPMVPGDHPLRSLTVSLTAAGSECVNQGLSTVRFADGVRIAAGRVNARVVVIVDQAEELFTLSGETERGEFLGLLADALEVDPRLWIIMILRSEFLTAFLGSAQARLFRDPVTVGTLDQEVLVEVIEEPARRAGLTFDPPNLPQRIAADAGGGDALPLLAYALQELYLAVGPGKPMTAIAYERIGGVTGVLTRQADKLVMELGGTDPAGLVLATLLKFVTIGENEPTRRRVQRSTLTEDQWCVVEAFLAARLLTSHRDGEEDTILQVAHEALFLSWAPLRQAIEASTNQLRWRADLERWAHDWERSGRQDAYLLRAERLEAAQRWATDDEVLDGLALVSEFLTCSNQADRATMERLSETIARQALATVDRDPDYSLLLALTAFDECAPTALALRAMTTALLASQVRVVLRGHENWVTWVAWSPDGRRLATASHDRTARIWDAESGNELTVLHGHDNEVWGVSWSPDGRQLATASSDQTARIWDAESGNQLTVLHGHDNEVWGVSWSPDGRQLATASSDQTARIWDAESGNQLTVLHGHDNEVWGVSWSPDGRQLATASHDRTARIWDAESGNQLTVLHGHDNWVWGVSWSPDGRQLATASSDRTARIWDAESGNQLTVLHGHDESVRGVAWSPDGRRLATASHDRTARIWHAESGNELTVLHGHNDSVRGVSWSPDGRRLATASRDRTARIWDAESGNQLTVLHGHDNWVRAVAWSPDGRRLATASHDRTARIWHAESGNELTVLHGHNDSVRGVAWSPDGRRLATASRDRTARIWDAESGNQLTVLHGHDNWSWGVAWSPDGRRLTTASHDRTARIWDAESGNQLTVLHGHDESVRGVAWSPDGRRLATASRDRTARIWDAESGNQLTVLHGHDNWVLGVAWSPDGRRLATASSDRTARIWDAESGAEIIIVGTHAKPVNGVSWSPDGRQVASASQDGISRIWDATISVEDIVAHAHRRVSRELRVEERRNLMLPLADQSS